MESKLAIDEVSETVGILKTEIGHLKSSDSVIHNKLDKIIDKLTLINGSVGKAHGRIDDIDPVLEKAANQAQHWDETQKKAKWLIGLGFIGSAGGGFSLSKFMGGIMS